MNRSQRIALLLLALALALALFAACVRQPTTEEVAAPPSGGAIAAEVQVDANGAANYTMSILVPPGTAGLAPSLALNYSSQAPSGLLGVGMQLSGLSRIERCPSSLALDGERRAVRFASSDRFCLDGQRLVLVGAGAYGDPGTRYATERQTWVDVEALGRCGSGPCEFRARNRDGWSLRFGATLDSRPTIGTDGTVAAWLISAIADLNDNTVAVRYRRDPDSLYSRPERIDYTANARTGLAARRAVVFEYESRPDINERWVGGQRFIEQWRMRSIQTRLDNTPVLTYRLRYDTSRSTGRSLASSIEVCADGGDCLPPTRIAWRDTANVLESPNSNPDGRLFDRAWCAGDREQLDFGDFNGDSRTDALCLSDNGAVRALVSTGAQLTSPNNDADGRVFGANWCVGGRLRSGDFNGDGLGDVFCVAEDGSQYALVSDGEYLSSPTTDPAGLLVSRWCPASTCGAGPINFDGDGRADLACGCQDGTQKVLLSQGDRVAPPPGTDSQGVVRTDWCTGDTARLGWQDFDGDERLDLRCSHDDGRQQVQLSTGRALRSPNADPDGLVASNWCVNGYVQGVDFNADGLFDLHCSRADGNQYVLASTGTQAVSVNTQADGWLVSNWCAGNRAVAQWSDFNGDGRSDLVCTDERGSLYSLLSTGSGLASPNSDASGLLRADWCVPRDGSGTVWTDFNGDAQADPQCVADHAPPRGLIHAPYLPDLASSVDNGMRGRWDLSYRPLSDAAVYTPGARTAFPILSVTASMYVVAELIADDGQGGHYASRYRYTQARSDLNTGRWLGFAQTERTEVALGRVTLTQYRQDQEYAGFVSHQELRDTAGKRYKRVDYEPQLLRDTRAPAVYAVLKAKETGTLYDNNRASFTNGMRWQYDDYGNASVVADLGAIDDPHDDVYTCVRYLNDTAAWRLGYVEQTRQSLDETSCRAILTNPQAPFDDARDLRWSRYAYDARLNQREQALYDNTRQEWLTTTRAFDEYGNAIAQTDPAGNTTEMRYDADYRTFPIETIRPALPDNAPRIERQAFDARSGAQRESIDLNGNQTRLISDAYGRPLDAYGPPPEGGQATVHLRRYRYGIDADGAYVESRTRPTWDSDDPAQWPMQRTVRDGLDRPVREDNTGPSAGQIIVIRTRYDSANRPIAQSVPAFASTAPVWSTTQYDLLDRIERQVAADGTVTTRAYREGERHVDEVTAAGTAEARTTRYELDARGNTVFVDPGLGATLRYRYDPLSQLQERVAANDTYLRNTRDSLGRITREESSDGGTVLMHYDRGGLLQRTRNALGTDIKLRYDAWNRITHRIVTAADGTTTEAVLVYDDPAYANGAGRLTKTALPGLVQDYGYDAYGRVAAERLHTDGMSFVQQQAFRPDGLRAGLVYPDGASLASRYDHAGNLIAQVFTEVDGSVREIAALGDYDALGRPQSIGYANGTTTNLTYNAPDHQGGLLQRYAVAGPGAKDLLGVGLDWNRHNQPIVVSTSVRGEPAQAQAYTYDITGRLQRAHGAQGNYDYAYDTAGNVVRKDGVDYTVATGTNQAVSASNGWSAGYDAGGNRQSQTQPGEDYTLRRDALGRLSKIETAAGLITAMQYDADSQRIKRVDHETTTTWYVSADFQLLRTDQNQWRATRYVFGEAAPLAALTRAVSAWPGAGASATTIAATPVEVNSALLPWALGGALPTPSFNAEYHSTRYDVPAYVPSAISAGVIGLFFLLYARWFSPARLIAVLGITTFVASASYAPALRASMHGAGYPQVGELYFHHDQIGSVVLVTNAAGATHARVDYEPFGAITAASSGEDDFRPKFTSQEFDPGPGYAYFGARYYDPNSARFIEPDSAQQYASPYTYVGNSPLAAIDPDGNEGITLTVLLIIALIGAVAGAYAGASAANGTFNPAQWDWRDGRTYAGVFVGAVVGAASAVVGAVAAEAGVMIGIIGATAGGLVEGATYAALGGGSAKDIALGALFGAIGAFVGASAGAGLSRLGSRLLARSAASDADEFVGRGVSLLDECASFPAGTRIATQHGAVAIEQLRVGADVIAAPSDNTRAPEPVLSLHQRETAAVIDIGLDGERVTTTPGHPFWTANRGWVAARDLSSADALVSRAGASVPVQSISYRADDTTVFNVEIARASTYFVGEHEVLVHNPTCKLSQLPYPGQNAIRKAAWGPKIKGIAQSYGDLNVSYSGIANGRFVDLDLSNYAYSDGVHTAIYSLKGFLKSSTRPQHFAYADKQFSSDFGVPFSAPRVLGGEKQTWHHMDWDLQLVPSGVHGKVPHTGGFSQHFGQ